MKIGIIYGLQNNSNNLALALKIMSQKKVKTILLLDKNINKEVAECLNSSKISLHQVWKDEDAGSEGDSEGLHFSILDQFRFFGFKNLLNKLFRRDQYYKIEISKEYDQIYRLDGRSFFLTLFPDFAEMQIGNLSSNLGSDESLKDTIFDHDIIISPDSKPEIKTSGEKLLIKPGSLSAVENPSFAIYDTKTNKAKLVIL